VIAAVLQLSMSVLLLMVAVNTSASVRQSAIAVSVRTATQSDLIISPVKVSLCPVLLRDFTKIASAIVLFLQITQNQLLSENVSLGLVELDGFVRILCSI